MPDYYSSDGYNYSSTINDMDVIITSLSYPVYRDHDAFSEMEVELHIQDYEGLRNILDSLNSNRSNILIRHDDFVQEGVCMSYTVHHEPTHISMVIRVGVIGEAVVPDSLDNTYPHKCKMCDKKLIFQELQEANRDMSEEDLKAMWISNEIGFYCCTCYRRANGQGTGWRVVDTGPYIAGEVVSYADYRDGVLWMGTNPVSGGFTEPIENCGNCVFAELYSMGGRRCSLEPTQIHQREYRCEGYRDTHVIGTTDESWMNNDTLDSLQTALNTVTRDTVAIQRDTMDRCDYICAGDILGTYVNKESRLKKIIKKIKKWFKK